MYKALFSIVLILFIFTSIFSFSGGDGSGGDPYEISSCLELQNISSDLSLNYELVSTVNCLGFTFLTLGNDSNQFTGDFNGNGNTISNLNITQNQSYVGLFGFVNGSTISNVTIDTYTLSSDGGTSSTCGGITAEGVSSTFSNIEIDDFTNVCGQQFGGVIGACTSSEVSLITISNLDISGQSAYQNTGGIIGRGTSCNVSLSSTSGSLIATSTSDVGGIVGEIYGSSYLNNVSSSMEFEGSSYIGGIIGYFSSSYLNNSFFTGRINGTSRLGGIIGTVAYTPSSFSVVENSYSSANMYVTSNYVGGAFGNVNTMNISNSYSTGNVIGCNGYCGGLVGNLDESNINNSYSSGDVTGVGGSVGGFVGQTDTAVINNSYSTGDVIGNGWTIGGFAAYITGGSISNSYSTGTVSNIGGDYTGGFIGYQSSGVISSSYSQGNVDGINYVGGFVGSKGDAVSSSYSIGDVSGVDYVGGFAGYSNSWRYAIDTYHIGSVSGNNYVGGFIGYGDSVLNNSYHIGSVSGNDSVGGFTGWDYSDIYNSYTIGSVSGNSNVGSFAGNNSPWSSFNNVYWNNISGNPSSAVGWGSSTGITAIDDDEFFFYNQSNTGLYSTWDPSIWTFDNSSFPTLPITVDLSSPSSSSSLSSLFPLGNFWIVLLVMFSFFIVK
jgi:hypothetical protein